MFSRFRWTRGAFFKVLPVIAVALLLTLVPFWVGAGEETPSVEDVRIQVERMFASEGEEGPADVRQETQARGRLGVSNSSEAPLTPAAPGTPAPPSAGR
jgi:hypothetical protein